MTKRRQIFSSPRQPLQIRLFLAPAAPRTSVHVAHPVMPRLYLASALSRSHTHALLPSGPLQYLLQAPVASVTCTLSRRGAKRRTRARRNLTPWTRVMTSPFLSVGTPLSCTPSFFEQSLCPYYPSPLYHQHGLFCVCSSSRVLCLCLCSYGHVSGLGSTRERRRRPPGWARLWIPPAGRRPRKCIITCSLVVYMYGACRRLFLRCGHSPIAQDLSCQWLRRRRWKAQYRCVES